MIELEDDKSGGTHNLNESNINIENSAYLDMSRISNVSQLL